MVGLSGVITALVTPFDAEGEVDMEALRRLIDFQVRGGVQGLFLCGTDSYIYPAAVMGCKGCITGYANAFPDVYARFWGLSWRRTTLRRVGNSSV